MAGRSKSAKELRAEAERLLALAKEREERIFTEVGKLALKYLEKKPQQYAEFFTESRLMLEKVGVSIRNLKHKNKTNENE